MNFIESIDGTLLGERLRIARSNAGLTQEEAAKMLALSRPTLVAIEQGQRKVRAEELRLLAEHYKIAVGDLLRPTAVHVDWVAKFRKSETKAAKASHADEAIRLLNRLATAAMELEARLGKSQVSHPPPERPILAGPIEEQAEDLALELRHRLGLGLSPIADIASLVELELGVRIFFRPLAANISGVFAYDPKIGACMLINEQHPRERQTTTIAHETSHFMTTRSAPDVVLQDDKEVSREEKFANLFAASLLMPAAAIRTRFRDFTGPSNHATPRSLLLMAHTFNVSFEAMARRLEALGQIKHGTFDSLKERGFAVESAKRALGLVAPARKYSPPRLTLLAVEANRRGILTEGQLCNMLALDRVQLREHLDGFGGEGLDDEIALET